MSTTITVEKNLICEQDMLIGREAVQQNRAGVTVVANPLRLLAVVDSIEQLKTLDTSKYDFAFIRRDFPIVEEGEPEPELAPGANEFYAFDFLSTESENIPTIVQPNATVVGMWKQITIGEEGVKLLIEEAIEKATQEIEEDVDNKIKEALEVAVPEAVDTALKLLTVKGFEFNSSLTYKQNDYVRAFVRSKGVVTERLYMVDKDTLTPEDEVDYAPLQGDTYRDINGTLIYEDNSNLQEQEGYVRVYTIEGLKKTFSVNTGSNYKLYEPVNAVYPKGVLKVRALKAGKVSGYFEITFGGTSHTDFSFRNVMYSKSVRSVAATSSLGYIFYPGFAAYCDETYFGLSVSSTTYVDSFELDYTDIDLVPAGTATSFVTNKCYALREGGGSYIPNIGMTYYNMRNPGAATNGDSTEFYNFMSGTVPWTTGIVVDENLYHQYVAACVMPTADASGTFERNLGGVNPGTLGQRHEDTTPNVRGSFDGSRFNGLWDTNSAGWLNAPSSANQWQTMFSGCIKKGSRRLYRPYEIAANSGVECYGFEIDASNQSSVFVDGAPVKPADITQQKRLQLF